MILTHFSLDYKHGDSKIILLYRFHIVVIIVNLLAVMIDMGAGKTTNAWIEGGVVLLLSLNAWQLRRNGNIQTIAYLFLAVIAVALFAQIWLSHFGTMSVVFVLLLPLTIMPFVRLSKSLLIELVMVAIMTLLLCVEYKTNPSNPILQNPKALFHLAYAALIIYLFWSALSFFDYQDI